MDKLYSGRIDNFKDFSKFGTIKEFNTNVEKWLAEYKKEFSKGELIGFKRLVRYAAKFYGVANAKVGTIVKAINDKLNGYGISRRTFQRMLTKAKKLGILSVVGTSRKRGGDGHNVYVFNTYVIQKSEKLSYRDDVEKRYWTSLDGPISESETVNLLETHNISNNKRIVREISDVQLGKEYTSDRVPTEFRNLVGCYYDCQETIEEFWKVVTVSTYYCDWMNEKDKLETACEAFRALIRAIKTKWVQNPYGYFYGVVCKRIDVIEGEVIAKLGGLDVDTTEDGFWPVIY